LVAPLDAELLLMMIALTDNPRTFQIKGDCARKNEEYLERCRCGLMWHPNLGPRSTFLSQMPSMNASTLSPKARNYAFALAPADVGLSHFMPGSSLPQFGSTDGVLRFGPVSDLPLRFVYYMLAPILGEVSS
jgi:hypothetical protein